MTPFSSHKLLNPSPIQGEFTASNNFTKKFVSLKIEILHESAKDKLQKIFKAKFEISRHFFFVSLHVKRLQRKIERILEVINSKRNLFLLKSA